ncbi:MAG: LptF/LptG family permease [Bacteroidota bacterium]
MKIKKLYILIIKSYLGPFAATFCIALFVLLMQFLWKYIDDLVGKGLEWHIIAELMFYTSSTFVPLALPLAILLSSIMTFGNLGEHSELTAIKASGISLQKIMRPLFVMSLIISLLAFYFSNNVLPIANLKMRSLLWDVRNQKPALNIKEGIFYDEIDGYVIKVRHKDPDGQNIGGVIVYDHTNKSGKYNITTAEKGKMYMTEDKRYLMFELENGNNYLEQNQNRDNVDKQPFQRTKFEKQQMQFDLSSFSMERTDEELFKSNFQMLNISQLNTAVDTLYLDMYKEQDNIQKTALKRYYYLSQFIDSQKDSTKKIKTVKETVSNNNSATNSTQKPVNPGLYDDFKGVNLSQNLSSVDPLFKLDSANIDTNFINNFPEKYRGHIYDAAVIACKNQKEYVAVIKDVIYNQGRYINKHLIEIQRKFTLSFACLILFFIGAPLGAIIRRGGLGLPLVASVLLFVMYHILSITGEKMAKEGAWNIYYGMWFASGIFSPLGIILTIKATTDTPFFEKDFYLGLFKRLFKKNKKQ